MEKTITLSTHAFINWMISTIITQKGLKAASLELDLVYPTGRVQEN